MLVLLETKWNSANNHSDFYRTVWVFTSCCPQMQSLQMRILRDSLVLKNYVSKGNLIFATQDLNKILNHWNVTWVNSDCQRRSRIWCYRLIRNYVDRVWKGKACVQLDSIVAGFDLVCGCPERNKTLISNKKLFWLLIELY